VTEPQMKVAAKRVRRRRRPSLTSGKLDPRHCGVALHAMVLDRNGTSRDDLVQRLEDLLAAQIILVRQPRVAYQQMQHPHTPATVREVMRPQLFTAAPHGKVGSSLPPRT
jgi:hypothetical protein